MAATSGENWNFSPRHRILFQKFARNHSISYHFEDIFNVLFSAKIQDGCQKWQKLNFSPLHRTLLYYPAGQKVHSKSLYLVRFSRYSHFFIFHKNPRWLPKMEIFALSIGYSSTTLWVKNLLEIALSRTVFEIFTLFHFPQKSKMATKNGENLNFSPLHKIPFYYPVGQKLARNRSISYGFRDIHTFSFSANI